MISINDIMGFIIALFGLCFGLASIGFTLIGIIWIALEILW